MQEPAAGSSVLPGSRVALHVSDGSLTSTAVAAPTAAVASAAPIAVPGARAADNRVAFLWQPNTMIAIAVSLLLGTLLGALSMRHWLLRPQRIATDGAEPLDQEPLFATGESPVAAPAAAAVTFFARLDAGEIAVQFPRLLDDEESEKEYASDR